MLKDYKVKWIKRDICFKKREDKKRSIFRKCLLKMIGKRLRLQWREKGKDRRISKPNKNIPACWKSKNKIVLMSSRLVSKEPRSS